MAANCYGKEGGILGGTILHKTGDQQFRVIEKSTNISPRKSAEISASTK
jgi:hypothetical protein